MDSEELREYIEHVEKRDFWENIEMGLAILWGIWFLAVGILMVYHGPEKLIQMIFESQ